MMRKYAALLAALLALSLLLGGCGAAKKAEKELERLEEKYQAVVASYDGGEVTVEEVMGEFNSLYGMYLSYLSMLGYEMTADDVYSLMQDAMEQHVRMEVAAARFDMEYSLTAEEISAAEEAAQAQYDQLYAQAIETVEGRNDAERQANARVAMKEAGYELDGLTANTLMWKKVEKMEEILGAEVQELSEEELFAAYEEKISEYQTALEDGSASIEDDMASENGVAYWMPGGYRSVKHILLIPSDEAKLAFTDAEYAVEKAGDALADLEEELADIQDYDGGEPLERSEEAVRAEIAAAGEKIASLEAELAAARQACLDEVREKTDEIYARLEAGEDFSALIAEFGEDPGMQSEPTASRGYYVSAASTNWEENFRDGALELTNPGDYSPEPVVGSSGVHIIFYAAEVSAGAASFDDVRDILYGETMETARLEHCEETIDAWVAELNPVYDTEVFSTVFLEE
ncbi:MAG: peptidylprolyl isomerase [Clostridia bacterium]|nr:peptidylprolyl isomerase [Clostridia bacterium]